MEAKRTFKINDNGQITIPPEWRQKFGLKEGDEVSVQETAEGGLIVLPGAATAMKALDEIGQALQDAGYTLKDLIEDGHDIRGDLLKERYGIDSA